MTLRNKLIRLAHQKPELRNSLLPLLKTSMFHSSPEAMEKYLKEHPDADKSKHTVKKEEKKEEKSENSDNYSADNIEKTLQDNFFNSDAFDDWEDENRDDPSLEDTKDDVETLTGKLLNQLFDDDKKDLAWVNKQLDKYISQAKNNPLEQDLWKAMKSHMKEDSKNWKKQSSLRTDIIRLAHSKPHLRKHLLPILKEAKQKKYKVEVWCDAEDKYAGGGINEDWYYSSAFRNLYDVFNFLKNIEFPPFVDEEGKPSSELKGERIIGYKDWKYDKNKRRFYTGNEFTYDLRPKQVRYRNFDDDEDQWLDVEAKYYVSILLNGDALDASELMLASAALKSGRTKDLPKM